VGSSSLRGWWRKLRRHVWPTIPSTKSNYNQWSLLMRIKMEARVYGQRLIPAMWISSWTVRHWIQSAVSCRWR
jgi:hypothetical protein